MSTLSLYLENVLEETGGFGRFQALLYAAAMPSKLGVSWSMLMMSIAGAVPDWWCVHGNSSSDPNTTEPPVSGYQNNSFQECSLPAGIGNASGECGEFIFDHSLYSVVNEWELICDRDWITSTITTIQMSGILVSGLFGGHLADSTGRKPTYFLSLLILLLGNIGCAFSISWEMFAAFRFMIGFGLGCFITVFYTYMIEFTPSRYRAVVVTIPTWPMGLCGLALVGWWLHDWQALHIANAVIICPFILCWWIIPESFRWLASHSRLSEAGTVINKVSRINGVHSPDLRNLAKVAKADVQNDHRRMYTIRDLFSSWHLVKTTICIAISWFCSSYVYYAISFGVQNLSGDIYFNFFLLQVIEIPAMALTYYLANTIGRRLTSVSFYLLGGLAGLAVAIIEISDLADKETIRTVFALVTKVSVVIGWSGLQLLTSESYPTVVRNIGYGLQSSVARVGSMIAPQIVYLNNDLPGIMYFLAGGSMLLTSVACAFIKETRGQILNDKLEREITIKDPEKEKLIRDDEPPKVYSGHNKTNMNIDDVENSNNTLDSNELIREAEKQMEEKF